jgi:hypothetical protein
MRRGSGKNGSMRKVRSPMIKYCYLINTSCFVKLFLSAYNMEYLALLLVRSAQAKTSSTKLWYKVYIAKNSLKIILHSAA